jgi:hypothetical protein
MSGPLTNPRRSFNANLPPLSTSPSSHIDSSTCRRPGQHNMQLRKGATFHSPTTPPSEEADPILNFPTLPRRSPTSTKYLENVIAAETRMTTFLGNFERNLSGLEINSSFSKASRDDLPVPKGILAARIPHTDAMDVDGDASGCNIAKDLSSPQLESRHRHASDSGLGTSIGGTEQADDQDGNRENLSRSRQWPANGPVPRLNGTASSQSAITRSISSVSNHTDPQIPTLGPMACKQIERFILLPILREKQLKPFHPLVLGIPQQIKKKEITCLRDLEKTFLFLAPRYSCSKISYVSFCEFSIQCIHTAVGFLNERDQRRPADRPYTNGYFLDLVEQIRQYAAMMGASRESQGTRSRSSGAENNLAYSSDEELTIEGGLHTGRPVELVRKKKGQTISLTTGKPYEEKPSNMPAMKRSLSMDSCDDSVIRSMARRKKNAPPLDISKKCKDCDKVFKRPCDLTKHEKTHSRPWKCSESACKYFELGWPTEKERDRHVNDKHSKSPPLFKCRYTPCTYQSKRESNCKQHMEKAHGWLYIRSKNTKNSNKGSTHPTPQTPNFDTPGTGVMDIPTPVSALAPSPYETTPSPCDMNLPGSAQPYPVGEIPHFDFPLFPDNPAPTIGDFSPFTRPLDFGAFEAALQDRDPNEFDPTLEMDIPSMDSNIAQGHVASGLIPSECDPTDVNPNFELNWDNVDNDYTVMSMQLLTPARSVERQVVDSFASNHSICLPSPPLPQQKISNLSPGGQGNIMLYSPQSNTVDEGYDDLYDAVRKPVGDFTLFESSANSHRHHRRDGMDSSSGSFGSGTDNTNPMFPPLTNYGRHYVNPEWPDQLDQVDIRMDVDDYAGMDDY